MNKTGSNILVSGTPISPGLAEGRTFVHQDMLRSLDTPIAIKTKDVEEEFSNLEDATFTISNDLIHLATRVEKEMDKRLATVFEAHQMMLNDPSLKEELRTEIRQNLVSASGAVKAVFLRWEKRFLLMESQVARHKCDDMRDLSNRLTDALAGVKFHPLEQIPPGRILVANRLLPSDTIFLSRNSTAAVLLERGGSGSHAALFAREMGLPCIANIADILERIPSNAEALVDANKGEVVIHPNSDAKKIFHKKEEAYRKTFSITRELAREPAITLDGIAISVFANVGSRADTERAMKNGAEGVGLYRTEQVYLGRATPPTEEELLEEMRETLEPAKSEPIYLRLLDIGADKPLPFIGFLAESNPNLGRRGIRLLREFPQLLETQLRAILKLSVDFDIRIIIPMITTKEDILAVSDSMKRLGTEMGISKPPPVGAMIETPAAALSVREFAPFVAFMSIGTNDLAQYTFAADRENVAVEKYYKDSSQVIFRLIQIAQEDASEIPFSVCGELGGRLDHIPQLLRCGIRALSVAPPMIPAVKEAIRHIPIQ